MAVNELVLKGVHVSECVYVRECVWMGEGVWGEWMYPCVREWACECVSVCECVWECTWVCACERVWMGGNMCIWPQECVSVCLFVRMSVRVCTLVLAVTVFVSYCSCSEITTHLVAWHRTNMLYILEVRGPNGSHWGKIKVSAGLCSFSSL